MKTRSLNATLSRRAFTLIELLVVIAIIGILAALLFPAGAAIKNKATRNRAQVELDFVANAINSYKSQYGHYPPDNPSNTNTWVGPLYYELRGTTFTDATATYRTDSGEGTIAVADFAAFFGTPLAVGGFINATKGGGEDAPVAKNFLTGIKPAQYLLIRNPNLGPYGLVLGSVIKGPLMLNDGAGGKEINPLRYRISGANRQNSESFDLWVDILVAGKTNRISNWSRIYEVVP